MNKNSLQNIVGMKFNRLTALEESSPRVYKGNTYRRFLFKCDCGSIKEIQMSSVVGGYTKSCGCLSREVASLKSKTHGLSKERIYFVWSGILNRCYSDKSRSYIDYGGRGIKICDEWLYFMTFKCWAENNGYSDTLTLERKNVNGNYCPENCKFIPRKEQSYNKRKYKNNSSGVVGVTKETGRYIATWIDSLGNPRRKSFSIIKYGEAEAFAAATNWRKQEIEKLKSFGIIYYNQGSEGALNDI